MAVKLCTTGEFCSVDWDRKGRETVSWKWGRLSKEHTYVLIFAKHQTKIYNEFLLNTDKVNVLATIKDCYNTVHPNWSSNTVVVFEKKTSDNGKSSIK
jgi:hypothetical protein